MLNIACYVERFLDTSKALLVIIKNIITNTPAASSTFKRSKSDR